MRFAFDIFTRSVSLQPIYEPAHAKRGLMALIMKSRNRASKSGHAIA